MRSVILTVSTPTYAIKAKRILRNSGIDAEIVKLDTITRGGCTHGISISDTLFYDAIAILREKGIAYSVYTEK